MHAEGVSCNTAEQFSAECAVMHMLNLQGRACNVESNTMRLRCFAMPYFRGIE